MAKDSFAIDADLGRFSIAKQQQIRGLAETITNKVPAIVWRFFEAVRVDDWETATNLANRINMASHRYVASTNDSMTSALGTLIWPPISESYGAYEQFHDWNNHWLHRFGDEIIRSIPPGSIYFGGTDPGRFIISVLSESQVEGKPFFTLTQNQLADMTYLEYLRAMYGKKIYLPTDDDSRKAFENYFADANERNKRHQLKPGEEIHQGKDGRLQVSGQIAVMEINGLLVKNIFDHNPQRELFIEESFPLDWMYPYLTPHGLIFQLNREPRSETTVKETAKDQAFWKQIAGEMLGNWLEEKTSLKDVSDFAGKYGLGKHLEDYPGDKSFAESAQTRKCFSKLRSSIAGMYAWRSQHAQDADERKRMYDAADFAFRQSYVICPCSPEAIYRYINLLLAHNRTEDAILIVKTSIRLDPDNQQLKDLLHQLEIFRQQSK